MARNHVEDHLSLAASSSLGRRRTSLTQNPASGPHAQNTPARSRSRCAPRPNFSFFVVSNTKGMEKPKQLRDRGKKGVNSPLRGHEITNKSRRKRDQDLCKYSLCFIPATDENGLHASNIRRETSLR